MSDRAKGTLAALSMSQAVMGSHPTAGRLTVEKEDLRAVLDDYAVALMQLAYRADADASRGAA